MKKITGSIAVLVSAYAYAGGTVGGSPGLVRDEMVLSLTDSAFNIESLPKTYIGGGDFRRLHARLSVDGTESIPAVVGDETIQVRKIRSSIVDAKISKEFLPSDGAAIEGGSTGGSPGIK
jgi:hypothetical protein